jgi:hypothetical protein
MASPPESSEADGLWDDDMKFEHDMNGTNLRDEQALEEGLEETFPASDPPAIIQPQRRPKDRDRTNERPAAGDRDRVEG